MQLFGCKYTVNILMRNFMVAYNSNQQKVNHINAG